MTADQRINKRRWYKKNKKKLKARYEESKKEPRLTLKEFNERIRAY